MIFHITTAQHWHELAQLETYAPTAFAREGFIHCCEEKQLEGVLNRYFKGAKNIVVLGIDETKLKAPLLYEPSTNHELFPHLYGEINKDAIIHIQHL